MARGRILTSNVVIGAVPSNPGWMNVGISGASRCLAVATTKTVKVVLFTANKDRMIGFLVSRFPFLRLSCPGGYTRTAGFIAVQPLFNAYMTKRDLVMRISDETGLAQVQVAQALEKAFDAIIASLSRGEGVEIRNFGVFEVRHRRPRVGRKPTDPSKLYQIPARAVVKFKPGKEMKEIVMKQATRLDATPSSVPAAPQ